ncbi:MAG: hypothetical protein EAY65_05070 [Alphaproteobacteria bacterium]|nr:MAG: hypothetical protein EAY65_05070 [Alphaproteobacteria bacterium]
MTPKSLFLCLIMTLSLASCGGTTSISDLEPPKGTHIMGKVISKDDDEFTIQDDTATLTIEATEVIVGKLIIGETVGVFGNLDEDDLGEFEAYRIVRADGTELKLLID